MKNILTKQNFIVLIVLLFLSVTSYLFLPEGIDWKSTYRPATIALLQGKSPYSVDIYYAAPWGIIPLIPFSILSPRIGRALLFVIGLVVYLITAYKLGGKKIAVTAFLFSPPVIHCLYNSNIEWLPVLGFILPPQIGLFFVSIKPQVGIGISVFWLIEAWNKGGVKEVIRVFTPITVALFVSFLLYGFWPLRFQSTLILTQGYNASIWPLGIPLGLYLLIKSIKLNNPFPAMASSPFFSPYALLHTYSGTLISVIKSTKLTLIFSIVLWLIVVYQAISIYH